MPARARRHAPALITALAAGVLATTVPGAGAREIAADATTLPPVRPLNVVVVLSDDQTVESVAKMPYVSSRSDWIAFDNAHAENALCCPARASILQGRHDTRTGVLDNSDAAAFDEAETLPVWLQRAGYRTGLFGKYLNGYPFGRGTYVPAGWDAWNAAYGFRVSNQYDYDLNTDGVSQHYGTAPADHMLTVLTDRVEQFIADPGPQPFFAFVTPTVNHSPWTPTPARKGMYATAPVTQVPSYDEGDVSDKPRWVRALPRPQRTAMVNQRRRSWAAAASLDDSLREIDEALAANGLLDRTLVVLVSDNGFAFGEHRWVGKRCEYDECGRVPLLVRHPGRPGRRIASPVSLVDLTATIAELTGATPTLVQDGRSLLPQVLDPAAPPARDAVLLHWPGGDPDGLRGRPTSLPQFWGVLTARWKYVELDTGERELYDRAADPYELRNRAGQPAVAAQQKTLADLLAREKRAAGVRAGAPLRTDVPSGEALPTRFVD